MTEAERIESAFILAEYGQIDGANHKTWVIDQMVRVLAGDRYEAWVAEYEQDSECEWDRGVAL